MIESNSINKKFNINSLEAAYLGKMDYSTAVDVQLNLHQLAQTKKLNSIMGLEHPAVITQGRRAQLHQQHNDQLNEQHEIPIVQSSRGGLLTIHSEGQLVIYPIFDLRQKSWGVKQYVNLLLEVTQQLLLDLGIASQIDLEAVGLYTKNGKIAFCGIQIKNGISLHGISLNVRNDLSLFKSISACGIENAALDRMQNYGINLTLEEIFQSWVQIFKARTLQS